MPTTRLARAVLVVALTFVSAGCGIVPWDPGPTHVGGTEGQPGPGIVVVEGDPPQATAPLVIEFVGQEGNVVVQRTSRIPTGGIIEASMPNLPGAMRLRVNGAMCESDFSIESDRRTTVVLRISDTGCSVETRSMEPM